MGAGVEFRIEVFGPVVYGGFAFGVGAGHGQAGKALVLGSIRGDIHFHRHGDAFLAGVILDGDFAGSCSGEAYELAGGVAGSLIDNLHVFAPLDGQCGLDAGEGHRVRAGLVGFVQCRTGVIRMVFSVIRLGEFRFGAVHGHRVARGVGERQCHVECRSVLRRVGGLLVDGGAGYVQLAQLVAGFHGDVLVDGCQRDGGCSVGDGDVARVGGALVQDRGCGVAFHAEGVCLLAVNGGVPWLGRLVVDDFVDDFIIRDGQRELGRGIGGAGVDDRAADFPVRRFLAGGQSDLGLVCAGHDHLVLELAFDLGDGCRVIAFAVLREVDWRACHGGRVFDFLRGLGGAGAGVAVRGVFVGGGRHDAGPRHAEGQCRDGGDGARIAQTAAVTFGHFEGSPCLSFLKQFPL